MKGAHLSLKTLIGLPFFGPTVVLIVLLVALTAWWARRGRSLRETGQRLEWTVAVTGLGSAIFVLQWVYLAAHLAGYYAAHLTFKEPTSSTAQRVLEAISDKGALPTLSGTLASGLLLLAAGLYLAARSCRNIGQDAPRQLRTLRTLSALELCLCFATEIWIVISLTVNSVSAGGFHP